MPWDSFHLRKSSCSARDCLGEPVETPESDPPLEVESRSLLQGTEADRRIVTVEPREEEREREHKTFSETLKYKHCFFCQISWTRHLSHLDLGMVTYPEQKAELGIMLSRSGLEVGGGGAGLASSWEGMFP